MQHFKSRLQAQNEQIEAKRREIDAANEEVLESYQELCKAEAVLEEHKTQEAARIGRLEQMEIDEIALNMMERRRR